MEKKSVFHVEITESAEIKCGNTHLIGAFPYGTALFRFFKEKDGYKILLSDNTGKYLSLLQSSARFTHNHLFLSGGPADQFLGFDNAVMMAFAFSTVYSRTLLIHASAIVHRNKAFLFLGKSGTGKSTHSKYWLQNIPETTLLNDDNPILQISKNGQILVYGSPWSGKTPCYKNAVYPLGGIVRIQQAPYNAVRQCERLEAFTSLFSSSSYIPWDASSRANCIDTVSAIASAVPSFCLKCLPNAEAARLCAATIAEGL